MYNFQKWLCQCTEWIGKGVLDDKMQPVESID